MSVTESIAAKLAALWVAFAAFLARAKLKGTAILLDLADGNPDSPYAKVAQADTVINGVIVVIIGIIGIAVVVSVNGTFDSPSNTGLSESQQNLLQGFGSMLDLVEPLLVVLMAVLVILAVMRIRR